MKREGAEWASLGSTHAMRTDEQEFEKNLHVLYTNTLLAMAIPWLASLLLGTIFPDTPAGWIAPVRLPGYLAITLGELPYALGSWIVSALLFSFCLATNQLAREDGKLNPWSLFGHVSFRMIPWVSYALGATISFRMGTQTFFLAVMLCVCLAQVLTPFVEEKNGAWMRPLIWICAATYGPLNLHCFYIRYFLVR